MKEELNRRGRGIGFLVSSVMMLSEEKRKGKMDEELKIGRRGRGVGIREEELGIRLVEKRKGSHSQGRELGISLIRSLGGGHV